jgi:hypothetical protein
VEIPTLRPYLRQGVLAICRQGEIGVSIKPQHAAFFAGVIVASADLSPFFVCWQPAGFECGHPNGDRGFAFPVLL